jgi:hypothetical protein
MTSTEILLWVDLAERDILFWTLVTLAVSIIFLALTILFAALYVHRAPQPEFFGLDGLDDSAYEVEPLGSDVNADEWYEDTNSIPIPVDPDLWRKARSEVEDF